MSYNPTALGALSYGTITRATAIPPRLLHDWRGQGFLPTHYARGSHWATVEELRAALVRVRDHPRTFNPTRAYAHHLLSRDTLVGLIGPYLNHVDALGASSTREGGGNPAPNPQE